ncbi:hypothetical protein ANN_21192 [Periplaneta americana]|uniref:Mos1 transposase HTH domain-containing protein n=1 Tax=Periplaneta americana TaxID=6978 RepID=A0ABQ8SEN8_PERAM|nr:hypothetical protein ANN_21192 [Periplaneta americana]
MNDMIDNPTYCEVRSVIRFLNARHLKPAEIYRQLKEVYGDTVMNERNVRKWCEMFNNGRTNVHDETRPGCPSLITEDLKTKVYDRILQDRRTSLDELHIAFPDISRSLLGEIVSQHLGYHKICAQWVPRQLRDQHKTQRMASALTFLMRYHTDGDAFLDQIVTGDETWVSHNTPETKRQSPSGNLGWECEFVHRKYHHYLAGDRIRDAWHRCPTSPTPFLLIAFSEVTFLFSSKNIAITQSNNDNDPKYTAGIVRLWFLYETLHTLKTPPQSPDTNPIENLLRTVIFALSRANTEDNDTYQYLHYTAIKYMNKTQPHWFNKYKHI